MNVLQRFGIAYFLVASMYIFMQLPISVNLDDSSRVRRALQDIWSLWPQWLVAMATVALHLGLTFGLPVPGCPR